MQNVLVINSSISGENGNSSKLTHRFLAKLEAQQPKLQVVERHLSDMHIGHISTAEMQAWTTDKEQRTPEQVALAALSDSFIAELQHADTIILGMPMYNFGVPSTFKAWIDRVARAGVTFQYTATGPVGLLKDKKVFVLAARGGMYAGTAKDTQTNYLRDVLSFLGITDVEFVYAEGLAMGPDSANAAWQGAESAMDKLAS
jgi:FMN-dependent NADH-azoreductase